MVPMRFRRNAQPSLRDDLAGAFPASVESSIDAATAVIESAGEPEIGGTGHFTARVGSDDLVIPWRIYRPEPDTAAENALERVPKLLVDCLYSRHHDGHVRHRRIRDVIVEHEPFTIPYVIHLVGEYVVEIVSEIQVLLDALFAHHETAADDYARFAAANPELMRVTGARVISYWNVYYRRSYPDRADYPGVQLVARLEALAGGA